MAELVGGGRPRRLAAGTVVSQGYLPAARVFAESFLRHHPDAEVWVLVLDATAEQLSAPSSWPAGARLLPADRLDLPREDYLRMAAAYSVTELATAVKPSLLRLLLTEFDVALYVDPDIEVFAPFDDVGDLAVSHGIVLTPHVTEPMPRDGLRPTEADIMASGVFNLGFLAVSSSALPFLDFWAARLRQDALVAPAEQMFTDQRWVDNVPTLFRHTVLTDPGFNVAYWNVYQREITRTEDGTLLAGGKPLRFYHFSGFRPERPWLLSTHYADRPRVLLSEQPEIARLCADYRTKLLAAGYGDKLESVPYGWAGLPDGTPLCAPIRRAFRDEWVAAERADTALPPSPFGADGAEKFLLWAAEPEDDEQAIAGMTRWAMATWRTRADLRTAFPEPLGADGDAYRDWCASSGVAEGALHPVALPAIRAPRAVPVRDVVGVNLLGYLSAELGVGEMGRLMLDAVRDAALPVSIAVEERAVASRTRHPLPAELDREPHYPVSVLCVNADMTKPMVRLHRELVADRYVIGLWSWELSVFPEWMTGAFADVDEVWTISEFCREAIAAVSPVPVRVFPVPVRDPYRNGDVPTRGALGSGEPTRFLFVFDHNSVFERKNPLAAVRAFQLAFGAEDDVRLVVKSINGDKHPEDREKLRLAVADDPRIALVERYVDHDEVGELFESSDCYLSLHRSEGFGLTVAEAMAKGLPVVATDYGGSTEFLTADTGWPIGYRLVPVGLGSYPYPAEALWAEPDIDAAASALRAVRADPDAARARGAEARRHVLATRSDKAAADWVAGRVSDATERWRAGSPAQRIAESRVQDTLRPLDGAREALRWRADAGAPSRSPLAPALRRVVLRAIDHYDHHQRGVHGAVLNGVEASFRRLDARVTDVEQRNERLGQTNAALRASLAEAADRHITSGAEVEALRTTLAEHAALLGALAGRFHSELDTARAGREDLDLKLMALLAERDVRIDDVTRTAREVATQGAESARHLHALDVTVRNHHGLLDRGEDDDASAIVATDVGALRLPADDTVMLPWLRHYATWEAEESSLVDHLLRPGDGFVDIGAHVGYFTVRALRRVGAGGAVFAVEPWAPVRHLLERNVAANVPAEAAALTVLPVAAWDADENLTIHAAEPGNSGDRRIGATGGDDRVEGVRLDGIPALADRHIRLVKCDAQGRDHHALGGLLAVLDRDRPHVLCEFWPEGIREGGGDPVAVAEQFADWGYDVLPVTERLVADTLAGRATTGRTTAGLRPSAKTLVRAAEAAPSAFVTLWLRPRPGPASAIGTSSVGG